MSESARALALAHAETLARLRSLIDATFVLAEGSLIPLAVPRNMIEALRELDRLEGIATDFEAALDGLAGMLMEGSTEGAPADEPS